MATQLKLRRGTTVQTSTFTGAEAEVTVDTTKDTLVVHDGATAGGFAILREDLSNLPAGAVATAYLADGAVTMAKIAFDGGPLSGFRNRLINGGFRINQRGSTSVADDTYCLDRWYALTETGNVTVAQQTDQENGTPFNIRLTQPDVGAKQIGLAQIIEASNCKDLRGKTATMSLRLRNSTGGQINYAVLEWSGTADAVTSDFISAWAGSPTYIANITERAKGTLTPSAGVWTDATDLNAAINAATNNVIVFIWSNADMAQNATLDIARVQLEEGAVATPFEFRSYQQELALTQRYHYRVQTTVAEAASSRYAAGYASSTTAASVLVQFPVIMRTRPGSMDTSGVAADYRIAHQATVTVCSVVPTLAATSTVKAANVTLTVASGLTAGDGVLAAFTGSTDAYLGFNAEL